MNTTLSIDISPDDLKAALIRVRAMGVVEVTDNARPEDILPAALAVFLGRRPAKAVRP